MSSTTDQLLARTMAATFEQLALLFLESVPSEQQLSQPYAAFAIVDFRGPAMGRLVLRASADVLPVIASNMLGEDHRGRPSLMRDALGELANVICGNLLPAMAGADVLFYLQGPRIQVSEQGIAREDDRPAAQAEFGVESGRVQAHLFLFSETDRRAAA